MLERVGGLHHFAGFGIYVIVALCRSGKPIGVVKPSVKPLRTVWGGHLVRQHVAEFIVECGAVFDSLEISIGFAPMGPAPGQPLEDLPCILLPSQLRFPIMPDERATTLIPLRYTGLTEIFLS